MNFYMPTKVFAETNSVKKNKHEFAKLGTCPLIVTGRHSSKVNGSLKDVEDSLNRIKYEILYF